MDIIQRILGGKKKGLGLPKGFSWHLNNGLWTAYGASSDTYIDKAYKTIPIIQAIISEIIDKASDAPPMIMRVKDSASAKSYYRTAGGIASKDSKVKMKAMRTKAFTQLENHPALDLFDNPNPYMTGKELREASMGYLLLTGNSIEYNATTGVGPRGKIPRQIWSVPSPCVDLVFQDSTVAPLKGYSISYMGKDSVIPEDQICHVKYFNPITSAENIQETFWGLSPLRSATKMISQKRDADTAQGSLFKNMAPAGMIVGAGNDGYGELGEVEALAINKHFKDSHMGVYNAGDILVTPANVRWEEIGLSPVDLQLIDWGKDIERQIARLYKYPDEMLESGGVVANSEVGVLKFIRNAVYPVISRYDKARTKMIRQWYNDDSLVYMSDLDYYPELQPDKGELVKWMRASNVFTQGEIRTALDYSEDYDESEVLVGVNLMFLDDIRDNGASRGGGQTGLGE
jgi:HK97 family phage portal protein